MVGSRPGRYILWVQPLRSLMDWIWGMREKVKSRMPTEEREQLSRQWCHLLREEELGRMKSMFGPCCIEDEMFHTAPWWFFVSLAHPPSPFLLLFYSVC